MHAAVAALTVVQWFSAQSCNLSRTIVSAILADVQVVDETRGFAAFTLGHSSITCEQNVVACLEIHVWMILQAPALCAII